MSEKVNKIANINWQQFRGHPSSPSAGVCSKLYNTRDCIANTTCKEFIQRFKFLLSNFTHAEERINVQFFLLKADPHKYRNKIKIQILEIHDNIQLIVHKKNWFW